MTNTINIQNLVVAEGLRVLSNELVIANKINRAYEDKFNLEVQDHKTGITINIPKPPRTSVRTGWTMSTQNAVEESVPLTIDTVKGDDFGFTDAELALLIPDPDKNMAAWSKRFLKPRITRLANQIDLDVFQRCYVLCPNAVGTPGTTPQTYGVLLDAVQKLDENVAPADDRILIMNPAMKNKIADSLKGTFVKQVSEKALLRGFIDQLADFEAYWSQNVPNQTVGITSGSTPLVSTTAGQLGSSIATTGWVASTAILKKGDIFTMAGCSQVNPVTGVAYSNLQQFVVTADTSSDGSGNATVPIFPAIVTSGPTATVTASPTASGTITVLGSSATAYPQNLLLHKDAFTIAFAKLHLPKSQEAASQATYDGFTMRYIRGYDIVNAQVLDRLDVYYGLAGLYPQQASRIYG